MKRNWIVAAAFAIGIAVGGAGAALGQAAASREILKTLDVAGTDRQASLGTANLPEGSAIAPHYHPGEELAFVADGQVVLKIEGQADQLLKAGDSYAIPRGMVHSAAPPSGQSARVVAVWITDKGQPLAAPAS